MATVIFSHWLDYPGKAAYRVKVTHEESTVVRDLGISIKDLTWEEAKKVANQIEQHAWQSAEAEG